MMDMTDQYFQAGCKLTEDAGKLKYAPEGSPEQVQWLQRAEELLRSLRSARAKAQATTPPAAKSSPGYECSMMLLQTVEDDIIAHLPDAASQNAPAAAGTSAGAGGHGRQEAAD